MQCSFVEQRVHCLVRSLLCGTEIVQQLAWCYVLCACICTDLVQAAIRFHIVNGDNCV